MQEMNNFAEEPSPEEANDIDSVIIEKDALAVTIANQKYYLDLNKMRCVDVQNPEELLDYRARS